MHLSLVLEHYLLASSVAHVAPIWSDAESVRRPVAHSWLAHRRMSRQLASCALKERYIKHGYKASKTVRQADFTPTIQTYLGVSMVCDIAELDHGLLMPFQDMHGKTIIPFLKQWSFRNSNLNS